MILRILSLLLLFPFVGCGSATDLSSKLVGSWQGRPETAAERLLREWPTDNKPTAEEAASQVTKTDLELLAPIQISMRLDRGGEAELSFKGGESNSLTSQPLLGKWVYRSTNARQGMLEVEVDSKDDEKGEVAKERRRFLVELIKEAGAEGDRFLLVEEGADPRYGRLLFERKSP